MAWYNVFGIGKKQSKSQPAKQQGARDPNYQYPSLVPYSTSYISNNKNLQDIANTNPNYTQAAQAQYQINQNASDGGGGGGASANPTAEAYAGQRQAVQDKLSALINAYNSLTGSAERAYATKAEDLRKQYGGQRQKFANTLSDTANSLTSAYQAKGLGDSSFAANAQNAAINNYNTDISNINQAEQSGLGQLGQALQSARGQYEAAKSTYQDYLNNLGNYGGQDLSNIMGSAETGLQNAAQAQAGMGSQADYINAINSVAPQQLSPTALQTQLQTLQNSGTSDFAKSAIAKGLISQATGGNPEQQTYWTDYFNSLKTTGKA